MKSLLLLFFVGLAATTTVIKDTAFQPGHEYVYRYDTQLLTGLPRSSQIHAGFRLSCDARVQFITYSKVRVQLEDIILYKVNEPIVLDNVYQRLMPVEYLKELTGKEAITMQSYLKIHFSFEYTDGIVQDVTFTDEDVEWSVNAKRAFISLFQMNLQQLPLPKPNPATTLLQTSRANTISQIFRPTHLYTVLEQSALGDCATLYTVSRTEQSQALYVTKVRDFSRCVDRPAYFKSIFENQEKSDYLQDEPLVQEANMKYSLRGDTDKFIILSAVSEGKIVFSPYKNQGEMMTSVNQTMHLRETKTLTDKIAEVQPGQHQQNTLRMVLPTDAVDSQDVFQLLPRPAKRFDNPVEVYPAQKIKLHLKLAAQDTLRLTSEHSLVHLKVAIDMLRTTPKPVISQLWNQLYTEKPVDQVSVLATQLLWKVLPNIATQDATEFVLDTCKAEFLMTENCTWSLGKLALRAPPTTEIINKLINLAESHHSHHNVKQAAYLALGSLGYKMNVQKELRMEEIEKAIQLLQTFKQQNTGVSHTRRFKEAKKALESQRRKISNIWGTAESDIWEAFKKLLKSTHLDDRVLALKSIGNSGIQEALVDLQRYLDNPAEPYILRILAVSAFRRMEYPQEACEKAISILRTKVLDTTERSEIRNLAFEIMTGLKPQLTTYETIADSLRTEKDKHVTTFILSFLRTHANSTYPPHWEMKKNATASILLGPTEKLDLTSAFYKQFSTFDKDYKLGGVFKLSTLGDQFNYKGAALSLETYILGYVSQFAEIGMNTEGLSSIMEKLFGPRGLLANKKSIFDLLKRAPRDLSPKQMIDHIFKLLDITPRTTPIPYGHLYFKLMGHELKYFDFTTALRLLATEGKIPVTLNEENLSVGLPIELNTMFDHAEGQLTLPTEAGIPVTMKLQSISSVDIKGNVELKVSPYMTDVDRQGSPPVSVSGSVQLQPRVVFGFRGSMGLDMFFYKPVVGFSGVLKTQTPVNLDFSYDIVYSKLKIVNHVKTTEKPVVDFLSEPFTQFTVIPEGHLNPVLVKPTQQIFAPFGARVKPISKIFQLNSIGYKVALTGQLPTYLSWWNVIRPLNGRTLINLFLLPMENAPRQITLDAQLVYPAPKSNISPNYANTYQNARAENPEDFGKDMDDADYGTEKYDKYGRRLPASLDDVVPPSDPIDLDQTTVTLNQLINKLQHLRKKPLPFYDHNDVLGLVMSLDASHETTKRQFQVESLWGSLLERQYNVMLTRFWRNALPNVDTQVWQALIEKVVVLPIELFEPKDVFDPRQQAKIMNELQYLLNFNSHKVINQILNVTVLSVDQQFNYPSMISAPPEKVIQSLVPEQLYRLMNVTGTTIYNRQWQSYWETLLPLYRQIAEERRVKVDRFYVKRNAQILELVNAIVQIQKEFIADVNEIISKGFIAHAERPILQAINNLQMKSTYLLRIVAERAYQRGLIDNYRVIQELLDNAFANVNLITTKVDILWNTATTVSQEVGIQGRPVVLFRPPVLRQQRQQPRYRRPDAFHDEYVPLPSDFSSQASAFYNIDAERDTYQQDSYPSVQEPQASIEELRYSLYNLTLGQMYVIKEVEAAIYNKANFDHKLLKVWIQEVRKNVTLIDQVFTNQPVLDAVVKEDILLATVQNSILVVLLEEWEHMYTHQTGPQSRKIRQVEQLEFFRMVIKEQGNYLAERSAFLYRTELLTRVMVPYLTRDELPIYKDVDQLMRHLIPQLRDFQIYMAYNVTNMRDPEAIATVYNTFITEMDKRIALVVKIENSLNNLAIMPKVYLVSDVMDAITFMKRMVEFARRQLLSIQETQRLGWFRKLDQQGTRIQTLLAELSPIFNKFNENYVTPLQEFHAILPTVPVNAKILDLQDISAQQKVLLDQIRKFVQNPDVTNTVLNDVMKAAVDRCDVMQETIKLSHAQVLGIFTETSVYQRNSVSAIYTQVLNQQVTLYESIRTTIKINRDRVMDVGQQLSRIENLEDDLNQMMNEKDNKLNILREKEEADAKTAERFNREEETYPYDTDEIYVAEKESETLRKPHTRVGVLHGIEGLINITWGQRDLLDKNIKIELLASRTVEQMLYIFKQMNAILRCPDVAEGVNNRLIGEPWKNVEVMRKLNSFNHLHLIANYDKNTLPRWVFTWAQYFNDYLKVLYWDQYTRQQPLPTLPEGQLQAMVDISDFNKQWDLYVLNNKETNKFIGNQQHEMFPLKFITEPLKITQQQQFNKQCIVNKNKLFTFDRVAYHLPRHMEQCRSLLAMDCSQEKAFAITILKSNSSYEGNILQILSDNREIEITPGYLNIEVKINGKVIVLEENVPVVYRKQVYYGQTVQNLIIRRKGLKVEVTLPLTGVYVAMQGSYVDVQVSEVYQRKVCGLCSNYDDQFSWEYEGPKKEIYTTSTPFVYSYILREGQCEARRPNDITAELDPIRPPTHPHFPKGTVRYDDIMAQFRPRGDSGGIPDDEEERQGDNSECQPSLVPSIRRFGRRKVCVSEKAVRRCSIECPNAVNIEKEKVRYICVDENHPQLGDLTRNASLGLIDSESLRLLPRIKSTKIKTVKHEVECQKDN